MKLKNYGLACLVVLGFGTTTLGQTVTTPRAASPAAEVTQTIGLSKITINYSRPSVKERAVWGALVPYGYNNLGFGTATAAPWRAGANENTTITFTDDAKVEGNAIPAGTYGFFVAVNENGKADVIFSQNSTSWGSFFYDQNEDQLRVVVESVENSHTEVLTYNFDEVTKNSTTIVLDWEKKRFPVKVEYDVDDIVLANARDELRNTAGFGWQGPLSAANYCLQNNINHEEAIKWADQALANNQNFNGYFVKAGLLQQTGKTDESTKAYDEAAQLANVNQLNFMGYQLMGRDENQKALEYFKLNVDKNPDNANCHDSLGECYVALGDNKQAIKSFKKSLSMSPAPNVKANSIKQLKALGIDTSSYEQGD